ncbi:hypothetical protein CN918_29325 [Priestia megaterium]|nr:hypothetical protein CN918_29325 [Priestia megaterium]
MTNGQSVQIKEEYRENEWDGDIGVAESVGVLDGSYTIVSYLDGRAYVKTSHLKPAVLSII